MGFLRKKAFSITVQGCRTNLYEADAIMRSLEQRGAYHYEKRPDFAVIVSCSITSTADKKCRKIIRRLRREHPDIVIVATGCYVQQLTDSQLDELGIDIAIGNRQKHLLCDLLEEYFASGGRPSAAYSDDIMHDENWDGLELDCPRLHTRAFLKVQEGCSNFCSYCIVPYVRGKSVCRDFDDAVAEAKRIVVAKCPEIVLTGVHLGLYEKLPELVQALGNIDGLKRIRFGSIEPMAVTDKLLDVIADTGKFCRHLHIPLQSGDDSVLEKMNRGYTTRDFEEMTDKVRAKLGADTHISTDLMIGFPTETDDCFKNSMRFIEKIQFGKIHLFPYSPREGTAAANWERPSETCVKQREEIALAVADKLHTIYCSRWLNQPVEIVVEEVTDGTVNGLTPEYVRVIAKNYPKTTKKRDIITVTPKYYRDEICYDSADSTEEKIKA